MRWAEGPVWFGDGRYLLWSDAALDRITRWDEETGQVSVFRKPANKPNGLTRDRQGRLLTCEHAGRRVTRTEYDGTITVLIDKFDGKRLNSPNDIVVKSDDSIWFTDPVYGITSNYSGVIDTQELPTNVYRLDKTGRATVVAGDINRPDGLAFSPDETKLYIIKDGVSPQVFRAYDVVDDGTRLANGRTFITVERGGIADGLRVDVDGNLWCGWGGGQRRSDDLQLGRQAHRPDRSARALRQSMFWRLPAQPAVHDGEPRDLCGLRAHTGRAWWLRRNRGRGLGDRN
jgi:gluconolactonase